MMVRTKFGFRDKKTTNNLEVRIYVVYQDSIFIVSGYRLVRGLATCAQNSLTSLTKKRDQICTVSKQP